MASAAIEVSQLGRRYGRRWALVDVSFRVAPGRVVMIAGRNGSGKSTLLRILSTAIRADRGGARVLGLDLRHDRDDLRQRVDEEGAVVEHDRRQQEAADAPRWIINSLQVVAAYSSVGMSLFVGWLLLSRMAGMGFSHEGKNYWMLKVSPVRTVHLLTAKFLVAYLPALGLGLVF